jgi:hypothetical protein
MPVAFQTYRGWVTKQGIEVKSWKHRWLVLDQEELLRYYGKKEDQIPNGTINLVGASVEKLKDRDDKKEKKFYFSVGTKDRTFHMFANTEEERTQWVDSIAGAIELSRMPSLSCSMTRKMKRGVLALTAVHAQAWIGCMEPVLHVWDTVVCAGFCASLRPPTYIVLDQHAQRAPNQLWHLCARECPCYEARMEQDSRWRCPRVGCCRTRACSV